MPRCPAISLFRYPFPVSDPGVSEFRDAQGGLSSGLGTGGRAKERGLENVFPEAPGTCSALSCVFAPGPWVLPCQECHLPAPITVEILSACQGSA